MQYATYNYPVCMPKAEKFTSSLRTISAVLSLNCGARTWTNWSTDTLYSSTLKARYTEDKLRRGMGGKEGRGGGERRKGRRGKREGEEGKEGRGGGERGKGRRGKREGEEGKREGEEGKREGEEERGKGRRKEGRGGGEEGRGGGERGGKREGEEGKEGRGEGRKGEERGEGKEERRGGERKEERGRRGKWSSFKYSLYASCLHAQDVPRMVFHYRAVKKESFVICSCCALGGGR